MAQSQATKDHFLFLVSLIQDQSDHCTGQIVFWFDQLRLIYTVEAVFIFDVVSGGMQYAGQNK